MLVVLVVLVVLVLVDVGVCCWPCCDLAPRLPERWRGRSSTSGARRCSLCVPSAGLGQNDREAKASVVDAAPPTAEKRVMNEGSLPNGWRERWGVKAGSSTVQAVLKGSARDESEDGNGDRERDGSPATGPAAAASSCSFGRRTGSGEACDGRRRWRMITVVVVADAAGGKERLR